MNGAERIVRERQRQIEVEGYDPERDEPWGDLLLAAMAYAYSARGHVEMARALWPWDLLFFKPTTPERDMEKAGALLMAALDAKARAQRGGEG